MPTEYLFILVYRFVLVVVLNCDTANIFAITFCGPSSGNEPDELVWKQYALKNKSNKELQVWKKFIV